MQANYCSRSVQLSGSFRYNSMQCDEIVSCSHDWSSWPAVSLELLQLVLSFSAPRLKHGARRDQPSGNDTPKLLRQLTLWPTTTQTFCSSGGVVFQAHPCLSTTVLRGCSMESKTVSSSKFENNYSNTLMHSCSHVQIDSPAEAANATSPAEVQKKPIQASLSHGHSCLHQLPEVHRGTTVLPNIPICSE